MRSELNTLVPDGALQDVRTSSKSRTGRAVGVAHGRVRSSRKPRIMAWGVGLRHGLRSCVCRDGVGDCESATPRPARDAREGSRGLYKICVAKGGLLSTAPS